VGSYVEENISDGNDVGVWFSNLDANCNPATKPTKNVASENIIRNNAIHNTSGYGLGQGYQAGITDQGDSDLILHNNICGKGYRPVATPPPHLFMIDVTDANNPIVRKNKTCGSDPVTGEVLDRAIQTAPLATPSQSVRPSVIP
jgi:hypothetical protein